MCRYLLLCGKVQGREKRCAFEDAGLRAFLRHRILFVACLILMLQPCCAYARTLEFWAPWPHGQKTVKSLAYEYSRRTGVTVRVRIFNPARYTPWSGRGTPDLVGLYNPNKRSVESLAVKGRIYNLGSEMRRGWYATFWPGVLETFRVRGTAEGVYGVPLTGQVRLFVYNKVLYQRIGLTRPPSDWYGLMQASLRFRRIGIMPYAGGFGSSTPPLAHSYEWSYLGLHNLMQTYSGRYPYTSGYWICDLATYPEMRRYGFTDAAWARMSETSAIKAMLDGRVAMVFVGPYFESIRRAYRPGFNSWGLAGAPIDSRARFLPRLPGGVVEGVVINSRSNNKAEAIRFLKWLTLYRQQVVFANGTSAIPATTGPSVASELRPYLRVFATGMRDQSIDLRIYERPQVLRVYYGGVRGLLGGNESPTAVARSTQAMKRR